MNIAKTIAWVTSPRKMLGAEVKAKGMGIRYKWDVGTATLGTGGLAYNGVQGALAVDRALDWMGHFVSYAGIDPRVDAGIAGVSSAILTAAAARQKTSFWWNHAQAALGTLGAYTGPGDKEVLTGVGGAAWGAGCVSSKGGSPKRVFEVVSGSRISEAQRRYMGK